MIHECEKLDAFLAGDLADAANDRFVGHLAECVACRETVDQQRWIEALLSSPLRQQLESPRAAVADSVHASIWKHRRRVRLTACGLTAAAVFMMAVGWTALTDPHANHSTVAVGGGAEAPAPAHSLTGRENQSEPPRATFVGGPDVLVVPLKSRHANVTIVRIYPAYQPSYTTHASTDPPSAAGSFAWPNDLNGGSL